MSDIAVNTTVKPEQLKPVDLNKMSDKDKRNLIADLEQKFTLCSRQRLTYEKEWYYNMAFYFGRQWVEWVGSGTGSNEFMRLYEPPSPRWRVRLVTNKIRPIVRNEYTKLTKENLQWFVAPNSTEDSDIAGARAAEQISEFLFTDLHFSTIRRRATWWALICGSAFMKDYFDPSQIDSSGMPGKICLEPVTAFHLFVPDLQEEDLEGQSFVIHAMAKDVEHVSAAYQVPLNPDASTSGTVLEQKFLTALGIPQQTATKLVFVKEAWYKPCPKYPEGALLTWANGQLLSYTPYWPLEYGDFPFSKIDHLPSGRFYGTSTIVDLIPLQKELNRTKSQIVESKNRMARPQLIAPKGSVDPSKITSEPGMIIEYTPGFQPPTPIPLAQLPSYVENTVAGINQDMVEIAGQYDLTGRTAPPGVEAASAIAYISEQNDSKLYHTVASVEDAIEKVGKHLLIHASSYWDAQRLVKVTGRDSAFEAQLFSNADIAGNTDFRVEPQSSAPRSRAAKQAFITEIGKLGWIAPDKALKYLDMNETNLMYKELQISARQAQRENLMMSQMSPQPPPVDPLSGQPAVDPNTGQPMMPQPQSMPVNIYDDDNVHITEHSNYCRSEEYEMLPEEIKQVHLMHLQQHMFRMQGVMQQQQQPQGQLPPPQGPPQQPPQGPPPQ